MTVKKTPRRTPEAENLLVSIPEYLKLFFIELLKLVCGLAASPGVLQITNSKGEIIPKTLHKEICAGNKIVSGLRVGPNGKLLGKLFFVIKSQAYDNREDNLSDILSKHENAAFCVDCGRFVKVYYIVNGGDAELKTLKSLVAEKGHSDIYRFSSTLPIQIGMVHLENIPEPISYYRMASLLDVTSWLPIQPFKARDQQVKLFNKDMTPSWFYKSVVKSAGDSKSIDYCWAGFIGTCGALLAKKIKVVTEYGSNGLAPNLWVCLVGEPGSGKTPVIEWLMGLIQKFTADPKSSRDISSRMLFENAIASSKAAEFKKFVKDATENFKSLNPKTMSEAISRKFKIEETQSIEYKGKLAITTDTTAAGLADLLQINELSVVVLADELKTLLHTLGSKDNTKLRGQLLQAESSNSIMAVTRANQSSKNSSNATISILSGIQPDALAPFITDVLQGNASNDGLVNRFLLTVKNVTPYSEHGTNGAEFDKKILVKFSRTIFQESFDFIGKKDGQYSIVEYSDESKFLFNKWKVFNSGKIDKASNKLLANHFNKYVGLVVRLSLIYQVMANFESDTKKIKKFTCVDVKALRHAIHSVEYLRTHANSIFSSDENLLHVESEFVLKRLIDTGFNNFTASQLSQKDWRYIKRDPDKTVKILLYLESFGLVRSKAEIRKTTWQVNPIAKLNFK